jgi:CHAT domain-containing protein
LRNQQATRGTILKQMASAGVLHFATHAIPNLRMPMLSALALWGEGAAQWLYAHEALQSRLNARLTVLSACRTSVGAYTADGALGLHWAFLAAGCPIVLATLWRLPDEAAPLWTEAFYTRYKSGDTPTDALRRACLQLRQNPRYAHPRYWGAWQAFGAV